MPPRSPEHQSLMAALRSNPDALFFFLNNTHMDASRPSTYDPLGGHEYCLITSSSGELLMHLPCSEAELFTWLRDLSSWDSLEPASSWTVLTAAHCPLCTSAAHRCCVSPSATRQREERRPAQPWKWKRGSEHRCGCASPGQPG